MNYKDKRIVIVDFETYFDRKISFDLKSLSITEYIRDSRFWALGLAYRFLDDDKTHWITGAHQIEAWVRAVDWKNTVVVAHNCKFDGAILAWRYDVKPFAWMDTMGLAKAVLGGNVSSHSLKRLAEYLGLAAKGEISCEGVRNPTPQQLEELGLYCKNDVELCKGIYEKFIAQFPQNQLWHIDWTIRDFVEPILVLNQQTLQEGVNNEKTRREKEMSKVISEIHQYRTRQKLQWYNSFDTHDEPFKEPETSIEDVKKILSSNKQFAEYLISRGFTVPVKQSARTGRPIPAFARTDAGLAELATAVPDLYAARIASKSNLLETRGESLLAVAKTGPFPFDVGFSGAVQTHRFSGGSGAGGNPQNFTRNSFLRSSICAPMGYSLVVGDFAAIELRLLAWLAKEPRLIGPIIEGRRLYSDFASMFYGRPINKKDNPAEDMFGKTAILGLGYQMGGTKFRTTAEGAMKAFVEILKMKGLPWQHVKTDVSEEEAWRTVDLYRTTYFNVPKLWEQAHALLPLIARGSIGCIWFAPFIKVKQNALVLPSGLEIKYPNLRAVQTTDHRGRPREEWVYDTYKKVYEAETTNLYGGKIIENICQALAGELCKEAIERAEAAGLRCVGQVHDEIIAVVRQDSLRGEAEKDAVQVLKNAMEHPPKWMATLKLKAEVSHGNNWQSAKV